MGSAKEQDRIIAAIDTTRDLLAELKAGLLRKKPLRDMDKLGRDISLAATCIEVLVTDRYEKSRKRKQTHRPPK